MTPNADWPFARQAIFGVLVVVGASQLLPWLLALLAKVLGF